MLVGLAGLSVIVGLIIGGLFAALVLYIALMKGLNVLISVGIAAIRNAWRRRRAARAAARIEWHV